MMEEAGGLREGEEVTSLLPHTRNKKQKMTQYNAVEDKVDSTSGHYYSVTGALSTGSV